MTIPVPSATVRQTFGDRLSAAIDRTGSRVVVGLDPHLGLLPPLFAAAVASRDREAVAAAVEQFSLGALDAAAGVVPAVKPQIAFFERLGPPGWAVLERVVARASELDLVVIGDAKRGDIGSTARAYADYLLGEPGGLGGLGVDALTVNPYLGSDSLEPFLARVSEHARGLFVLARTSNPSAADFQLPEVVDSQGRSPLYERVAAMARRLGAESVGKSGYSSVGIVVGATGPDELIRLRTLFPELPFLVPGVGAQGASVDDVAAAFDADGRGAVVNASRSLLFAYRDESYADRPPEAWAEAMRTECRTMTRSLNEAIEKRKMPE